MSGEKIRVLIVDDSSVIRTLLSRLLSSDPEIEVVGTAPDPYIARDKLIALKPDVMCLDVEMPRMDGVSFLEKVMASFPTRTVMISSLTTNGSDLALRALSAGAIDVMAKPAIDVTHSLAEMGGEIIARVKMAAKAKIPKVGLNYKKQEKLQPNQIAKNSQKTTHQIIAIASSTGGTEGLKAVLTKLPADCPGILIVQHMPPIFTKTYAAALNQICPFEVREAIDGERVIPGLALLAPGNYHMELIRRGAQYYVQLNQAPTVHGVRPAADILMNSIAKNVGPNAVGVVLTGMGKDGAKGLLAMKNAGSFNIAQDEESCVVFGMPKEAIQLGAIDVVLPLQDIAMELQNQIRLRQVA